MENISTKSTYFQIMNISIENQTKPKKNTKQIERSFRLFLNAISNHIKKRKKREKMNYIYT